jgi:hypothetical protein
MKKVNIGLIILLSSLLIACNSEDAWDFFKTAGKTVTIEREVSQFTEIELVDRIDVVIVQDTIEKIFLNGPKNLISKVSTVVKNNSLKIVDNNNYNWVRGYNNTITATVHIKHLKSIYYEGVGNISSQNDIISDTLIIDSQMSSGDINLDIVTKYFHCYFNQSMVNMTINGTSEGAHLQISGTGFLRCANLITGSCFTHNQGSGDIIAYSSGYIAGIIEGSGNVLYTGNPNETVFIYKGRGSGSFIEF